MMLRFCYQRLLRDPLLHFILIGLGLFMVSDMMTSNAGTSDSDLIVVDRDTVLAYLQQGARATTNKAALGQQLDALSQDERAALIDRYIQDEVLYREAKALGLGQNDTAAKRRLIQQMAYLTRSFIDTSVELEDSDVEGYYTAHSDRYYKPPEITFSHVFIRKASEQGTQIKALTSATALLKTINDKRLSFNEGPSHGDRFLYHPYYVAKAREEIRGHFGQHFAAEVFALPVDQTRWHGPLQSDHGFHLVMLTQHRAGYLPPLSEIRHNVERDTQQAQIDKAFKDALQTLIATYKIDRQTIMEGRP